MYQVLDRIDKPETLKSLSKEELSVLCDEIRDILLNIVTNNGGHLGSNLGAVELTIALHRVFDSPRDKIIWDVGHQSYVHKLLTGRKQRFSSLRTFGGISGFPDPDESQYDSFSTGHASTSISAGLGMAIARDLAGEDYNIIAVIGDGGLTGGMSFEALNHAGHLSKNLIVVLTDNGMSISPTVGALAKELNKIRLSHRFHQARAGAQKIFSRSFLGRQMEWTWHRFTQAIKAVVMPTMIWEELGFTYIGPIDGHNISEIEKALYQAKSQVSGPAFIHVITMKGKGHELAESTPDRFHSVSPKQDNGNGVITYSQAFSQTVLQLMKQDPRILVITAAMTDGNCLQPIAQAFPERFFDVGICEQHAVTLAAGLSVQGFIPVVAIYSTFLQRGFDQILNDVCVQDLPVVFAIDRSGLVGEDGKTHQGIFDLSYLTLMPNMIVAAPRDEAELQNLLYTATKIQHPVAVRYPRGAGTGVPLNREFQLIPAGKGEMVKTGSAIAIVAIGACVQPALEAAWDLAKVNIDAAVVNARFAKPIDRDLMLTLAAQFGRIVTVEENTLNGGFGSSVLELLEKSGLHNVKLRRIGIPDEFVEHGSPAQLRAKYNLDAKGISQQVRTLFPEISSVETHPELR